MDKTALEHHPQHQARIPVGSDYARAKPAENSATTARAVGSPTTDNSLGSFALTALSSRWRPVVVLGTVIASLAHIPVIGPHLIEAPYMGVLFIVLTAACAALAAAVVVRDSREVYAWVILTCGLAVIGYAATRLVAFPMLSDDVGNWLEPLGVVSILSEGAAVAAAIAALIGHRHGVRDDGRRALSTVKQAGTAS